MFGIAFPAKQKSSTRFDVLLDACAARSQCQSGCADEKLTLLIHRSVRRRRDGEQEAG